MKLQQFGVRAQRATTSTPALTSVPLANADGARMSEFFGSARQSRVALKATGKLASMTMTGYYEADWLELGHNLEQQPVKQLHHAPARTVGRREDDEWLGLLRRHRLVAGCGNRLGPTRGTQILPSTIDAQYDAGFVWARQESFRVTKDIDKKVFVGISAENAETLNAAGQNLPSNYIFGSTGTGGGLYNATPTTPSTTPRT